MTWHVGDMSQSVHTLVEYVKAKEKQPMTSASPDMINRIKTTVAVEVKS